MTTTTNNADVILNADDIFRDTIALAVSYDGMGRSRKVSLDNVEVDADKDRLNLSSRILQCDEMSRIRGLMATLRELVSHPRRGKALPAFFKRGVFLIPTALVPETEEMLRDHARMLAERVEDLIAVYPERIAEDRIKLRDKFDASHYPTPDELRRVFKISWRYLSIAPTAQLQSISADIYQTEVQRVRREVEAMGDELKSSLRQAAYELVAHMQDRLAPGPDGKPKVFRGSVVTNLVNFLATFDAKNIMGDAALSDLLAQMRRLLEGVDPKSIKSDDALRTAIKAKVDEIAPALDALVKAGGRQITLADDEPEPDPVVETVPVGETCKKHRGESKPCGRCRAESQRRAKARAA